VGVFGNKYNERVVPIKEETALARISGFIVKPQNAKRTRGEQFFFVNNRFIKSPFLHRAIINAFDGLITTDQHPGYFIFLDVDPSKIDVNIHPTKTEIKFEEEHLIFATLKTAVKKSLGQFNIAPSIDFDNDIQFQSPPLKKGEFVNPPKIDIDPEYNPFEEETVLRTANKRARGENLNQPYNREWESVFEGLEQTEPDVQPELISQESETTTQAPLILQNKYIMYSVKSGVTIINIKRALGRIFYQEYMAQFQNHTSLSQQLLFPVNVNLSTGDMKLMKDLLEDLSTLGFDLTIAGPQILVVNGAPLHISESEIKTTIEELLESAKHENREFELEKHKRIAQCVAVRAAGHHNKNLTMEEQRGLIDRLFACENPFLSLDGKPTLTQLGFEDLDKYFK